MREPTQSRLICASLVAPVQLRRTGLKAHALHKTNKALPAFLKLFVHTPNLTLQELTHLLLLAQHSVSGKASSAGS